ncbi:MAG: PD-(D/E)XK nuclease family protein [Coriobacteriia bacterium]|nr:PD-(D/E)XK nuclease family protein [Coriobacteriia bacterium]
MQNLQTYSSIEAATQAACGRAAELRDQLGRSVLLVPTYAETVRVKKHLAAQGIGFGVAVVTPAAWIADAWELFGDARALVCPVDRLLLARKALKHHLDQCERAQKECGLLDTPGTVRLVADVAKAALPVALAYEPAPGAAPLNKNAQAVLQVLYGYNQLLEEYGLTEESSACALLAQAGAVCETGVVALDCQTTCVQDQLLATANAEYFQVDAEAERHADAAGGEGASELDALRAALYHPNFTNPVQPAGQVRFAFPAGAYAAPRLMVGELVAMAQRLAQSDTAPHLALTAHNPVAAFDKLASGLLACGISVSVDAISTFDETDFGRAWMALLAFANNLDTKDWDNPGSGHTWSSFATDFDLSPFSFMGVRSAQKLDARGRGWRGQTVNDALSDMTGFAEDDHRAFLSAVAEGELLEALQLIYGWVAAQTRWPEAYKLQQLSAIQKACGMHARANQLGLGAEDALRVLQYVVVPVKKCLEAENHQAQVSIARLQNIGRKQAESFDGVVLCDLTAAAYPLKDDMRAVDLLLESLGAYKPRDRMRELRRSFAQALAAARGEVLLERCLHDETTEEERPAALLEELVDCYRADPQNPKEVHEEYQVPPACVPFVATLGEEEVAANLAFDGGSGAAPGQGALVTLRPAEHLRAEDVPRVVVPRLVQRTDGSTVSLSGFSPSGIEKYLDCPYKWFAQNRLGTCGVDADFGPLAFGNFAHSVLENLHLRLHAAGLRRVTPENVPDALRVLGEEFERLRLLEQTRIAGDALIPLSHSDNLEIQRLKRQLEDFVAWEANLLSAFEPFGAELAFGDENPFEYAGVLLKGRVDRVDIDPFGHAAVIDYKGGVGKEYAFFVKDAEGWQLPRKVQTAIYAQVIRRKLGLVPVAAIYVAYKKPGQIAGLYDREQLHPETDLCGIDAAACGSAEFLDELDRCEEAVALQLERARRGDIAPCPADKDSCRWCPVLTCAGRMA